MAASLKARAGRSRKAMEEQTLPLINVVFLLLIFFMIAGKLSPSDPFPITSAQSASTRALVPEAVVIHMAQDGALAYERTVVSEVVLVERVKSFLGQHPHGTVQLKVNKEHQAKDLLKLLSLLRTAGLEKVNLVTELEPEA